MNKKQVIIEKLLLRIAREMDKATAEKVKSIILDEAYGNEQH